MPGIGAAFDLAGNGTGTFIVATSHAYLRFYLWVICQAAFLMTS